MNRVDTELTWAALRAAMERAGRTKAWIDAGIWALQTLEVHLGRAWPGEVARKTPNGRPSELAIAAHHAVAYSQLLELALRLELLRDVEGSAKVRRAIATDPRPTLLMHVRIQLEVAALVLKAHGPPKLEPSLTGQRPADIAFDSAQQRYVVEARTVLTSDAWRDESERTDALFERIHAIERKYGVRCELEVQEELADDQVERIVGGLEDRARLVAIGASPPALHVAGVAMRLEPEGAGRGAGLRGPEMRGDTWARIGRRIADKAELATESGANWLRLDAVNGLWQFTRWAQLPLDEKLRTIVTLVRGSLGSLDGVILSSGALLAQGEFQEDRAASLDGAVAVRRLLAPLRVRETLIVPSSTGSAAGVDMWERLYTDEPEWLSWALTRLGLPTPDEVFAV
jgi:hypothetical protein